MIKAKEIHYPDGTIVEKMNLISDKISLSKMDAHDWDNLFDNELNPTAKLDLALMDCLFTLTPMLNMVDIDGNKINMGTLEPGQVIEYKGENYTIHDTEKIAGVFDYILESTGKIKMQLEENGVN